MAQRGARTSRSTCSGLVVHTERLTPHMHRVVLGGPGLDDFTAGEYTDHYVKLLFPHPDVTYPEPFDMAGIRQTFPRDQWPVTRTYTVRAWDPVARELTIDFVIHGDRGIAGPWAVNARVGDEIHLLGPGGAYTPDPEADRHLLAGDESALPAIAAAVERMPAGAEFHALVEVPSPEEEQKVASPDGRGVVWLHRGDRRVGELLVDAVRGLALPNDDIHAFVHGEAGFVKELRRHLRIEREIPRERLSVSGYWRLGHDEDAWQSSKTEWNAAVEAEQEA
ncbi:siderophore-interacting protein [Spiractinospora alimapuensis]|uniref:siderophore-interacting protein n=1 Tax=Spiractinospora alimapuensis TaxID=2820884 RepID=UPI001F1D46A6|nr:siderophore-interacting protein [Spiractinospora alimapuensis]QVQ52727.1 siderophore-interacting protein [Spiractinospora alimapuensis]